MNPTTEKQDEFDALLDSYLAELMAMSDEEVLDGQDPEAAKADGLGVLEAAKAEAGKRRLLAAKRKLAIKKSAESQSAVTPTVSANEARAFLRKASNDSRFTLAARGLDEMSDEDALRLYEQVRRLEQEERNSGTE